MAAARPLLAALLLALAVAPSHQLPAATGLHRRRLAGSKDAASGGSGGDGWVPSARRQLTAVQPLTPVSTQVQGQEVLYQVPKQPVGMVVLLHKCGRSAGGWDGHEGRRVSERQLGVPAICAAALPCTACACHAAAIGLVWHQLCASVEHDASGELALVHQQLVH